MEHIYAGDLAAVVDGACVLIKFKGVNSTDGIEPMLRAPGRPVGMESFKNCRRHAVEGMAVWPDRYDGQGLSNGMLTG